MDFRVTEQDIAVNGSVFSETVEQAIDTDFTLPDYCPDISRILKCRVTPRINSSAVTGGMLTIEGTAYICLIYADEEQGDINSFEYPWNFTKTVETEPDLDGAVKVRAKTEFINCRAVSSRRVDIHGAMSLDIKMKKKCRRQIVCDIDAEGVQMLRENVSMTSQIGDAEKYIIINDDMTLSEEQPSIRTIIRSDASAAVTDCKIVSNKAVIKGDLAVSILYSSDTDRALHVFESVLPISQIVDIEGINEDCCCVIDADVITLDVKPRTGMNGETRAIGLSAKILVSITAYCNAEVPVMYDVYCTKCCVNSTKDTVTFERMASEIRESFECRKSLELPADSISTVLDMWCDSSVDTVRCEDKKLIIAGKVVICMLGEDSEGSPAYFERPVDYEYSHDLDSAPEEYRCTPSVVSLASSYNMTAPGSVEVKVELNISAEVFEIFRKAVIVSAEAGEDEASDMQSRAALIIYYAEAGEKLWDIAKFYNTSIDEVMSLNGIGEEVLSENAMLLIPSV